MILFLALALVVFAAFVAIGCVIAIIGGDKNTRRAASGFLLAVVATQLASMFGSRWHSPEYGVMIVDVGLTIFLTKTAIGSAKWWPIWAAACQLAGTLAHLMPILVDGVSKTTYLIIQPVWGLLVLSVILAGMREARKPIC